jgi:L-malate glycosyltransferase
MHIGIVSPCSSAPLRDLLPQSDGVDLGCGVHFMATLVRALLERGHRLSVITLSSGISKPEVLLGEMLSFYVFPMRTQKRMRDLYKFEREGLRSGIASARPDVLHAHWTYEFAMACLETRIPTVVTTHDNAFQQLRFSTDLFRLGQLLIQIYVIRKSHLMTAVSPYLAKSLQWLATTKIEIIPNPINVADESKSQDYCGNLKIATVLNGWGKRKNAKTALKAFSLLRKQVPTAELFMYGHDFEDGGPASQWAITQGLSAQVYFRGFTSPSDLQREMRSMALLLHPALEEACPLALLEAMAIGLPIVAHKTAGGVPWVLDNGRAGFLTNMTDVEQVAHALIECSANSAARELKRRSAYDRVMSLFSPSQVAQQYESVYERALALK